MLNEEILTAPETAKELGITVSRLLQYHKDSVFMPTVITRSGKRLYRLSEVLKFKERRGKRLRLGSWVKTV